VQNSRKATCPVIFGAIFLAKENNTRIKDSIGLLTAEISTLFNIEQYATADA
jgi:hypothetical protein